MKAEDIKVVNVKGVAYAVDAMSENVQKLVSILNEWRQDEVDARSKLMMIQAAQRELSREIVTVIDNEQAAAAAAMADAPVVDAPVADAPAVTEEAPSA